MLLFSELCYNITYKISYEYSMNTSIDWKLLLYSLFLSLTQNDYIIFEEVSGIMRIINVDVISELSAYI